MTSTPVFSRVTLAVTGVFLACLSGAAHAQENENKYYRDRFWSGFNGGQMNISSFVFRDMNANGEYDMGDRPFANVAVEVNSPSGGFHVVRSNISGFANFRASATRRQMEIVNPGAHNFRVVPPPGWRITTGNQQQQVPMELLLGSPGDLVAATPTQPVGLIQLPEIRGRIAASGSGTSAVSATGPEGEAQAVEVDADGAFSIAASPGAWLVQLENSSIGSSGRRIDVGHVPVVLPLPTLGAETGEVEAKITGFDEMITTESVAKIPGGYDGLDWHNWVVTHNRTYDGEGYINGTLSGEFVAYNGSGHPAAIDSDEPFHFIGGYFTGAWSDAEGEMVTVKAWRGDTLAHEDRIRLSAMGPVYFAADYRDITRLEFATEHYWQVVVDDMAFARP